MAIARSHPDADFGMLLNLAFRTFKEQLHGHLRERGFADVGAADGYVLRTVQGGDLNLKQLAQALGLTPQGTLKVVDDMVLRGYLTRRADATDGRVKRLQTTARADALLKEARRFHALFEARLRKRLGATGADATRKALEAIVSDRADVRGSRWELL